MTGYQQRSSEITSGWKVNVVFGAIKIMCNLLGWTKQIHTFHMMVSEHKRTARGSFIFMSGRRGVNVSFLVVIKMHILTMVSHKIMQKSAVNGQYLTIDRNVLQVTIYKSGN